MMFPDTLYDVGMGLMRYSMHIYELHGGGSGLRLNDGFNMKLEIDC